MMMVRKLVAYLGSALFILASTLAWLGFVATECTQCNTASLVTGVGFSTPVYVLGLALFSWGKPTAPALVIAGLSTPLIAIQVFYAVKITYVVLVLGVCACAAYYDPVFSGAIRTDPPLIVQASGPILLLTGTATLWLIVRQGWKRIVASKPRLEN